MKKKPTITVMIIVAIIIITSVILLVDENENDTDRIDNGLLFIRGDQKIYINETRYNENTTSNATRFFSITPNQVEYNETERMQIAKIFFKDPAVDNNSDSKKKIIKGRNQSGILEFHVGRIIKFRNESYEMLNIDLKLSDEEIINISKDLIQNIRGNYSDLDIDSISTALVYKVNTSTNDRTLLGYEYQRIVFIQKYNGFQIKGGRGKIMIEIGKNGTIEYFEDTTIEITNKTTYQYNVDTFEDVLRKRGSRLYRTQTDLYIDDWELVLHTDDKYYLSHIDLRWELKIRSLNSNEYTYCYI